MKSSMLCLMISSANFTAFDQVTDIATVFLMNRNVLTNLTVFDQVTDAESPVLTAAQTVLTAAQTVLSNF